MENIFKQFLYTGVGLASNTGDWAKELLDKLVEKEKENKEDGKKIVDEFMKNTETKKDELENQLNSVVEKMVKSFKFGTSKDLNSLINRVTVLEAVVANKKDAENAEEAESTAKTATRKPTARKTTTPAAAKKDETKADDKKNDAKKP